MATVGDLAHAHLAYRDATNDVTGATSGANPPGKLWLPIWSGEVIHAYDEYNMFEPLVTTRVIPSGTTVEIPVTGTVDLKPSWDAGEELVGGMAATATTFKIVLDKRPMAAHFEIDNVDLMLTQWEFRNELARQAALRLANTRDRQIYSYICRAAMSDQLTNDPRPSMSLDSVMYGDNDGNTSELEHWGIAASAAASRATGALSALEAVEKFIVHLQANNIPYDRLYLACTPQAFMDIRSLGVARLSADFDDGGRQSYFTGQAGLGGPLTNGFGQIHDTLEYMGCTIVKSNHVTSTNYNSDYDPDGSLEADGLGEAKYNLQFGSAGIVAAMWTPECIAGIRLQGLKVDTVDDIRRNTTFTVASMMSGTGVLRPECAAVISSLEIGSGAGAACDQDRSDLATLAAMDAGDWADA